MDYRTDFICTYQIADDDDLYRSQFLQAFDIKEWNSNVIANKTDALFKVVEKDFEPALAYLRSGKTRFTHLMIMMGQHLSNDNLFRVLFVYDLFHLTHRCICDIINDGDLNDERMQELARAVRGESA